MLNSKQTGNITEMQCMLTFMQEGFNVLTPYGDCERYDFVADVNGELLKIQVKTSRPSRFSEGCITFNTSSQTTEKGKQVHHSYDKSQIDYFMTYYENKAYLIPVQECSSREKTLRFVPPKNGQIKGITFAQDYEFERMVNKIINK